MTIKKALADNHNLFNKTTFRLKSSLLTGQRSVYNLFSNLTKFSASSLYDKEPVIAFSESELWNNDDNQQNWILTAGKIQNLRIASKLINGIEIPAGKTFSLWKHLGYPSKHKGYVVGREIREGCIVPTVAGGLCQLSNALYDAALKANFEIIERHKHTKVIQGSLAQIDRDATIKWNYVDLRFKAEQGFKIEVDITTDKLTVLFRSIKKHDTKTQRHSNTHYSPSKLNDCYSCGNFQCSSHPTGYAVKQQEAIVTFILDDKWSEFDEYIKNMATDKDFFIVPLVKKQIYKDEQIQLVNKKSVKCKFNFLYYYKKSHSYPSIFKAKK